MRVTRRKVDAGSTTVRSIRRPVRRESLRRGTLRRDPCVGAAGTRRRRCAENEAVPWTRRQLTSGSTNSSCICGGFNLASYRSDTQRRPSMRRAFSGMPSRPGDAEDICWRGNGGANDADRRHRRRSDPRRKSLIVRAANCPKRLNSSASPGCVSRPTVSRSTTQPGLQLSAATRSTYPTRRFAVSRRSAETMR